jgi:phosphopantothenoylcysteine decarboxylase/phosphopantothenate--cysteine ligase
MGVAIAEELFLRGASVQLVLGPSGIEAGEGIKITRVTSANDMYEACMKNFDSYDIVIMAAAVADYTPKMKKNKKIKKTAAEFSLELVKTEDILAKAGELKKEHQTVVGFALETDNEKKNALKKLSEKNADLIVLNSLNDMEAGFGYDTNKITIFDKNRKEYKFPAKSKKEVAGDIVNAIIQYRNE